MKKAAAILARRAHSRGELRKKLAASSPEGPEDGSPIEAALNRLEQLDLLNDADYAYNFSFRHLKESGWGPAKIRAALHNREVAEADIDRALECVFGETETAAEKPETAEPDAENVAAALRTYIERYCQQKGTPSTGKDARKLARHLAGRGFEESLILDALGRALSREIFRYLEGE